MPLGAIADEAGLVAGQVHRQGDAVVDVGLVGGDELLAAMQLSQQRVAVLGGADAEADLRQARALPHHDREGLRADLGIERAMIAGGDLVEGGDAVGDHAREDVEPAGRAFRVGGGGQVVGQRHALQQRHDIDAAGLQHGALGQVDHMQLQVGQLVGDDRAGARQEACPHPIGACAEPEVEAGRLQLVGQGRLVQLDVAGVDQAADRLHGQDAGARCRRFPGRCFLLGLGHPNLAAPRLEQSPIDAKPGNAVIPGCTTW